MKKIFLTLSILTLIFTSCERVDYGDININPYSPTANNIDAMMRGAMARYGDQGNRPGYDVAACYAQYLSQPVYSDYQRYNQFKGVWSTNYVNVLNPLKIIANTTSDVRGNTVNYNAIAELTSVLVWKKITDTFGDVPYFEALQGGAIINPAYTTQREIYLDLIARTKAARDMIDTTSPSAFTPDASTDIYYGGDMNKWGKFANSMILALAIQLTNTSEAATAKTEFIAALGNSYGVIENNADNLIFTPDTAGNMQNPISKQRGGDYNISKELTDALLGNGVWGSAQTDTKNTTSTVGNSTDNRIAAVVETLGDGLPYGYESANYTVTGVDMSHFQNTADSDFVLMSASYTWLNRAEASLASVYATGENTNTMFANGVQASFDYAAAITGYALSASAPAKITERLADVSGSVTMAQVIAEEKWFALFPDGYAAWAEQRRTGFPMLHPAPEASNGGVIPHRMLYPDGESGVNTSGWSQGVSTLTPADDKNTSKIWWEN
jgi:hypothetical protein